MKNYTVITPVKDAAGIHQAGEVIELSDKDGAELLGLGAVAESTVPVAPIVPQSPVDETVRLDAIKAAIVALDKNNADLWLKDGKPSTDAIAAITGWLVTAGDRNTAWTALQPA